MLVDHIAQGPEGFEAGDLPEIKVLDVEFELIIEFVGEVVEPVSIVSRFVLNDLPPEKQAFVYASLDLDAFIEGAAFEGELYHHRVFSLVDGKEEGLVTDAGDDEGVGGPFFQVEIEAAGGVGLFSDP